MSFPDIKSVSSVSTENPHPQSIFADHSDVATKTDSSEAKVTQQLYQYALSAAEDWLNKTATEGEKLYQGSHWTAEQKAALLARGQNPTVIQAIYQLIEQMVDMLTANTPSFRATPVEDTDVPLANAWSDLIAHMWYASDGQMHFKQYVRDSSTQGRGLAYVYIDPNLDFGRGEVVWKTLDGRTAFPDPESTHPLWDDASFVIVRTEMTYYQLCQISKEAANKARANKTGLVHGKGTTWTNARVASNGEVAGREDVEGSVSRDKYELLERYEKVKVPFIRLYNPTTGQDKIFPKEKLAEELAQPAEIVEYVGSGVEITTRPDEVAQIQALYDRLGPIHHKVQDQQTGEVLDVSGPPQKGDPTVVPGSHVVITPTSVGILVEMQLLPMPVEYMETRIRLHLSCGDQEVYEPAMLPTSTYPLIPLPASHNRTPFPQPDTLRVRDLQDIINKSLSLILAHAANSTNMKVFYPDGSIEDVDAMEQNWGKAGTAFIPYDAAFGGANGSAAGGIVIAAPPPLPTALYTNMDRAYSMMERILGIYSIQAGDPSMAPSTYKGTLAIDEMGQRRIKGKMDTVYASLTRIGQVMRDYAQHHYTEEKIVRIFAPSGDIKETTINYDSPDELAKKINDITSGRVDVRLIPGSTLPNNRWAKQQVDLEMFDRGIIDDIAVLKHSEYTDANEILERKSIYVQLQGALESYQKQVSDLEGDVQTWQREAQHAQQKAELEKFKSSLARLSTKVQKDAEQFGFKLKQQEKVQEQLRNERMRDKRNQDEQQNV
jgi:hypothetical protein